MKLPANQTNVWLELDNVVLIIESSPYGRGSCLVKERFAPKMLRQLWKQIKIDAMANRQLTHSPMRSVCFLII